MQVFFELFAIVLEFSRRRLHIDNFLALLDLPLHFALREALACCELFLEQDALMILIPLDLLNLGEYLSLLSVDLTHVTYDLTLLEHFEASLRFFVLVLA